MTATLLKRLVTGTRFEASARSAVASFRARVLGQPYGEWDLRFRRDEARLARLLPTLIAPGATCVDIGAQRGVFLEHILRVAPDARLYAVEPLAHWTALLRTRYPQATVFECALGERTGDVPFFFVPEMPGLSGLRDRGAYPAGGHAEPRVVPLRRLDDLLPDARVDFVKIDVEGAEMGVLRGGEGLLRRCRPVILFEHLASMALPFGTTPELLHDFFEDLRMDVLTLDRKRLARREFCEVVQAALASRYRRHAETDFVAKPRADS